MSVDDSLAIDSAGAIDSACVGGRPAGLSSRSLQCRCMSQGDESIGYDCEHDLTVIASGMLKPRMHYLHLRMSLLVDAMISGQRITQRRDPVELSKLRRS